MTYLVVGGGGREHTIIRKLKESPDVDKIYCTPGNGGISKDAEVFHVAATDIDGVVALAEQLKVDCVFVAPDDPLVLGMVDALREKGIRAFGPDKKAAIIEGRASPARLTKYLTTRTRRWITSRAATAIPPSSKPTVWRSARALSLRRIWSRRRTPFTPSWRTRFSAIPATTLSSRNF